MEKRHLKLRAKDKAEVENQLRKGSLPVKVFKRVTALLELSRSKSFGAVARHWAFATKVFQCGAPATKRKVFRCFGMHAAVAARWK